MRVLFTNLAHTATLSALHQNDNYPVANLLHPFLKKIYKSTAASDTVTMAWAASQVIDCIFMGFTNATSATLRLKNYLGATIYTQVIDPADVAVYFTAVSGVRSATLEFAIGSGVVYLGSIGIGFAYQMPNPIADMGNGNLDNSIEDVAPGGQVSMNKIAPLRQMSLKFITSDEIEYAAIKALIEARVRPVFIDVFALAHTKYLPMYGIFPGGIQNPSTVGNVTTFSLSILEAR